jgi:hypothetical protein
MASTAIADSHPLNQRIPLPPAAPSGLEGGCRLAPRPLRRGLSFSPLLFSCGRKKGKSA